MDEHTWDINTKLVRSGLNRTDFHETSEAMFLTSGFVYPTAEDAEAAFAGETDRYIYSRYGNPTIAAFEERMAALEGAEACQATATGMAAVFTALLASVRNGDRVVASRSLFGSCFVILDELLPRYGVTTVFVDGTSLEEWAQALDQPTAAVFFETPSNPMQDLIDVRGVAELAHAAGATVIVDNVFATALGQSPLALGADVVVYSTTKHIDGQGRTLGGAILGTRDFVDVALRPFIRHTGPSMSPFTAWLLLKSLETLNLRMDHQMAAAAEVATALSDHTAVASVRYPMLATHPQHQLAVQQMSGGGTVVTFNLVGGKAEAFAVLNALTLIDISNNLGDSKTLITHPASTTHRRIGPQMRAMMGIGDATLRLSVGLEAVTDLLADLDHALTAP